MPTFKLVRRPRRGAGAAKCKCTKCRHSRQAAVTAAAPAVPDPVASDAAAAAAAVPDPAVSSSRSVAAISSDAAALPAVSAEPHAEAGARARNKRRANHTEEVAAANKESAANMARTDQAATGTSNGNPHVRESRPRAYVLDNQAMAASNEAYIQMVQGPQMQRAYSVQSAQMAQTSQLHQSHYVHMCLEAAARARKRDGPKGVYKTSSGNVVSEIYFGGKRRRIGTFATLEQGNAAYMSVKEELSGVEVSALSPDKANEQFAFIRKRVLEALYGGPRKRASKRDLPQGIYNKPQGKYQASVRWSGKRRYIGTFDSFKQAHAAQLFVEKDLDGANTSVIGADEANALFETARLKAIRFHWL